MKKQIFLTFLALVFIALSAKAQQNPSTISGAVVDSSGTPIPYAEVFIGQVIDRKEQILQRTHTDLSARFTLSISPGNYMLGISHLGYKLYISKVAILEGKDLDLGKITLEEDATELQTVVVQGRPMTVRNTQTGFSVNVTELRANRNNALDLLAGLPNIFVKGEELFIPGKKNILLKIGNVVQRVSQEQLPQILKGYDAQLVRSVEVVMQPPLRYDKDGNTAMIILHMESKFLNYFGGILGTEIMSGELDNSRYGGYASSFFNLDKLSFSVSPYANINRKEFFENATYYHPNTAHSINNPSTGKRTNAGISLNLQYNYSSSGNAGLHAEVKRMGVANVFESTESFKSRKTSHTDSLLNNHNIYRETTPKYTIAGYWEQALGSKGAKVWADLSYYNYSESKETDFGSKISYSDPVSDPNNPPLISRVHSPYFGYRDLDKVRTYGVSSNIDFSIPLAPENKWVLDAGLNAQISTTKNRRSHAHARWKPTNNPVAPYFPYADLDKSDAIEESQKALFSVLEQIYSPYLSTTIAVSKEVLVRLGVKLPYTVTATALDNASYSKSYDRVHLLPSAYIAYTPSVRHKFYYTLNSGMKRPQFDNLNPFEWKTTTFSIFHGNPYLKPETSYRTDLGYTYRGILSIAAQAVWGRDVIASVTGMKDGIVYRAPKNAQQSRFLALKGSYYFDKLSWMTASVDGYYGQTHYTSDLPELQKSKSSSKWGIDGYLNFVFNKSRTFTGFLSGSYTGKTSTAIADINPEYELSCGLSAFFFDRALSVSIAGLELINSSYSGTAYVGDTKFEFDNNYSFPTLYLSVSYKFGKAKESAPRKRLSHKEVESRF
ncbi:MAG: outer membrane beta-barrel family protein [Porphyromonas sp.]|nr:outer membrane beta-barrel family protein [Porphyromonas sp.]